MRRTPPVSTPVLSRLLTVRRGLIGLAVLAMVAGGAAAETFVIAPGSPNEVKFTSKAPLETFDGKTRNVSGTIEANLGQLADSFKVEITVDLASLDTGIDLRNQHMREEHLETSKYPQAVFHGRSAAQLSQPALHAGETVTFICHGTFDLHGVTQPLDVPVEASLKSDQGQTTLQVTGRFDVKLSDYKISRPQFLVMRLDESQHVTVTLAAVEKM